MSVSASLVALRAEISKKREEVAAKGQKAPVNLKEGGYKWKLLAEKLDGKEKVKLLRNQKKRTSDEEERRAIDEEIEKQLQASREALERKAAIYEARMDKAMKGVFQEEDEEPEDEDAKCLIDFDGKAMEQVKIRNEERKKAEATLRGYKRKEDEEGSEDWVEFTDSFGRTRRCLRKDLSLFVDPDKDLARDQPGQSGESKRFKSILDTSDSDDEEKTQAEPEGKEGPVHYTDVRFDEIRDHGVSFIKLSGDSEERSRQLNELNQLHEQAVKQSQIKAKEKQERANTMEQRLARIAARRGLKFKGKTKSPEEDNSDSSDSNRD